MTIETVIERMLVLMRKFPIVHQLRSLNIADLVEAHQAGKELPPISKTEDAAKYLIYAGRGEYVWIFDVSKATNFSAATQDRLARMRSQYGGEWMDVVVTATITESKLCQANEKQGEQE